MNTFLIAGLSPNAQMMVMMALVFVVMYFFMIRPQRKKEKELQALRDSLKKGDAIITAGGIYGEVFEVEGEAVVIVVESQAKLKIAKSSISIINGVSGAVKK
jgi:preprotein translocase subunit YajC